MTRGRLHSLSSWRALIAGLVLVASNDLTAQPARDVALTCAAPGASIALSPQSAALRISAPAGTSIEVRERDIDVTLAVGTRAVALTWDLPPRFGIALVPIDGDDALTIAPTVYGNRQSGVALHLHCTGVPDEPTSTTRLSATAKAFASTAPPRDVVTITPAETADDPWLAALAIHAQAQRALMAGSTADAATTFARAESAWLDAGDATRALVARLARTEDVQRLGQHAETLDLVADPPRGGGSPYFAARLALAACPAYRYLARYDDADRCYRDAIATLDALDERAEFVSAVQGYAELKRLLGRLDEADALSRDALALVVGADAAMLRGRLQQSLAEIAQARGDVGAALTFLDAAIASFREADLPRWEGNAQLHAASIYLQLGALPEAYDAVTLAFARFPPRDAPARVALALMVLARIEDVRDRPSLVRRWLDHADRILAGLDMPLEHEGVRVLRASRAITDGDYDLARRLVAEANPAIVFRQHDWDVVRARLALIDDASASATKSSATHAFSLADSSALAVAMSRRARQDGDAARARTVLDEAIDDVRRATSGAGNPLLRHLLARHFDPVAREAASLALDDVEVPASIWPLVAKRAELAATPTAVRADANTRRFDEAIARDLFPPKVAPLADAPALLALLKDGATRRGELLALPALATFQSRLDPDVAVLTHLDTRDGGVLMLIRPDRVDAGRVPDRATLDQLAATLRHAVSDPSTPLATIDAAGASLTRALFGTIATGSPPRTLRIDRESMLATMPWPVLRWPGATDVLAATTSVEIASTRASARPLGGRTTMIDVLVAASDGDAGDTSRPARLTNTHGEATELREVIARHGGTARISTSPSRDALLQRLAVDGVYLHVAAHGYGDRARIGHAGVWLGDPATGGGGFVGWTDPVLRGVRADLVVLNACSLAAGDGGIVSSMSFATALSRAGAGDVVAALWPTSDAAATIWAPAFYDALLSDPSRDVASALNAAQMSLRQTRAFRHPFYWASLVHITAAPAR